METNKCLYCYQPLSEGEKDFHARCAKKMFGTPIAPDLPYTRSQISELAKEIVRAQTAIPGVQPKLSLDVEKISPNKRRFTIVGLWGGYILKPQTDIYPNLPELEDLTMHLAEMANIKTVPHSLMRFVDGELCYVTRRIDRSNKGEKIPMEDFCQLLGRMTEDKYRSSHEQIAKFLRQYSTYPAIDLVDYWEQVIFSWIVGNADMHLKNYSLYDPDGQGHRLTPAYDLISTKVAIPNDTEELALTLCGKKKKLTRLHFEQEMLKSDIPQKTIDKIFSKFRKMQQPWIAFIKQSFLPPSLQDTLSGIISENLSKLYPK